MGHSLWRATRYAKPLFLIASPFRCNGRLVGNIAPADGSRTSSQESWLGVSPGHSLQATGLVGCLAISGLRLRVIEVNAPIGLCPMVARFRIEYCTVFL